VGKAKVLTLALPVPLEGPAYFVSHGGEAFPDLTIVLKGYGVTIDLVGSTSIKSGITTSTFKATPDVPLSSFELARTRRSRPTRTSALSHPGFGRGLERQLSAEGGVSEDCESEEVFGELLQRATRLVFESGRLIAPSLVIDSNAAESSAGSSRAT
jgi:hypothetical protein